MKAQELKNLLKQHHLSPNFTYGQNFLIDNKVLAEIVSAAELTSFDSVLEIGPGIGNLTGMLLGQAGFVLSVEKDPKFLPILKILKKRHKNFRYEIADVLEFNFQDFFLAEGVKEYKVVANIPYYVSGKLLQMLLTAKRKPTSITLLLQKEVAKNVVAAPGDLNVLAISVQIFGQPKIIRTVPAESFYPAPKVDSAILHIDIFGKSPYAITDEKNFFRVLKACFAGKRKQVHNTLVNNLLLSKEEVFKILQELKINPAARPQELTIVQWVELAKKINSAPSYGEFNPIGRLS